MSVEGDITTSTSHLATVGRRLTFFDNNSTTHSDRESLLSTRAMAHGGHTLGQPTVDANNRHTLRGKPRKIWTYIFDWIFVIAFIVAFIIIGNIHGHQREFSLTDQSIMYTMAVHETVPSWLLVVCAAITPITIIVVWTLFIPPLGTYQRRRWMKGEMAWKERLWDVNLSLLGIGLALAAAITFTNTFKNLVGRPRPDFLDRCQPLPGATNPTPFTLSNSSVCTQTIYLADGYRSWPSGHSSTSWSGLGFLALFMAGRLNVLDTRGQVWKTALCLVPLCLAGFIAVSRLIDNRHHPFDVICGSILGMLFAWMAYRQYFPSIATAEGGRPYSIVEFGIDKADQDIALAEDSYRHSDEADIELGRHADRDGLNSPRPQAWNTSPDDRQSSSAAMGPHNPDPTKL